MPMPSACVANLALAFFFFLPLGAHPIPCVPRPTHKYPRTMFWTSFRLEPAGAAMHFGFPLCLSASASPSCPICGSSILIRRRPPTSHWSHNDPIILVYLPSTMIIAAPVDVWRSMVAVVADSGYLPLSSSPYLSSHTTHTHSTGSHPHSYASLSVVEGP